MMTNLYLDCKVAKTMLGDPCVFPFYWNGTQYYKCIDDDGDIAKWCATTATEVDLEKGMYQSYKYDKWGYCAKECLDENV